MVGLALTVGLYPIGFMLPPTFTSTPFHLGPWLLPGLIPLAVGLALISSYYLEQNTQSFSDDETQEKVTSIQDHFDKRRREGY
jgi:hypothetical protein